MESFIFFTDGKVTIRPFQPEDTSGLQYAIDESRNSFHWLEQLNGSSLADVEEFIRVQPRMWNEGIAYNFAVLESEANQLAGVCGLSQIDRKNRLCRLNVWIRTTACGKGTATRAVALIARFAFESLGMQRMEILVEPDNLAALRVAEKAGAISEGYLRKRFLVHGESKDAVIFSLVPEDLQS